MALKDLLSSEANEVGFSRDVDQLRYRLDCQLAGGAGLHVARCCQGIVK